MKWHDDNVEIVGQSVKLNSDCMIHAALEDDRERLGILYSHGYRLGNETDRRITKVAPTTEYSVFLLLIFEISDF